MQQTTELPERIHLLREAYWRKEYCDAAESKVIQSSGDESLVGRGLDFAAVLDASSPHIEPNQLIAGVAIARPAEGSNIEFGHYDGHYPPGHANLLAWGWPEVRDRARRQLEAETDPDKRDFLEAVAISYDAAIRLAERYAAHLNELAGNTDEPERRRDLTRAAAACTELAAGPPATFHGALQMQWFTFMFGGRGSIGRFDQWMYPFLKEDLESGRLTKEEAQELLECMWVKLNYFAGNNDSLRNMALAGQTPEGEEASNELTFMCLLATEHLQLPEPKLAVRFIGETPHELLVRSCELIRQGLSMPALYNDDVAVEALSRMQIPIEDARDYCNDGCEELIIGGKCTISFRVYDTLAALNETVFQAEEQPYEDFDQVMETFKGRLEPFLPDGPRGARPVTFPYFAASISDCLEAASTSGARYAIWGNIIAETTNTADGLAAIAKLIFEEGKLSWPDLIQALRQNYEGSEPLRQTLLNRAPKFGNDIDTVDQIASDIVDYYCQEVHARGGNEPGHGSKTGPGLMSFGLQGKRQLPATPDGRRQGDCTANSYSPALGRDRRGPTAVLNSVAKTDCRQAGHGSVLDLALHPSCLQGQEGLTKLVAFTRAFLERPSVSTLQINVIDRETLLEARDNPDDPRYRSLIVRVWGFSAVFVELIPELQEHVIERTQHAL
ncbi:MAG: pyruvate formate lyase family protein [Planctomycetota bacterium]|jgi:formate C-acetyltransferase|nr:pyruvate formate lyase family protein [Planctomycetota bacterium]